MERLDVTADTAAAVSNITMRNIYIYQCTQMLMIKTLPGGTGATGYVKDSVFENFWAYDTTYGLGKHCFFALLGSEHRLTNIRYRPILGIPHNSRHRSRSPQLPNI